MAQHEAAPPTQSTDAVPASLWSGGNGGAVVPQIRQLGGGGGEAGARVPACAVSGALGQPARCPGGNRQFPSQIKAPKLSRTESPHGCNSPKVPPHTHQPPAPPQPPGSHASLVLHRPRAPRGTQVPPPPCTPPGASRPRWYPWRSLPPGQGCRSIPRTPTRAPSAPRLTAAPRCPGVEWQWERAAGRRRGLSLPLEQHRERAGKREKKAEEGKEAGEEKKN